MKTEEIKTERRWKLEGQPPPNKVGRKQERGAITSPSPKGATGFQQPEHGETFIRYRRFGRDSLAARGSIFNY
jgi:hypothetical protein